MRPNFEMYVHVDLGVTPALVALVNTIMGLRQMPEAQQPSASEQPTDALVHEAEHDAVQEPSHAVMKPEEVSVPEPAPAPEPEAQPVETPLEEAVPAEAAETPAPAEEPRELTEEDIREAMHRTRQRIEGENYKDETDSERYKKYHRQLTAQFKNIAAMLGADKPSALPAEQRAAFIAQCDELIAGEDGVIMSKVPF